MTTESYMKRYHTAPGCEDAVDPADAEAPVPACVCGCDACSDCFEPEGPSCDLCCCDCGSADQEDGSGAGVSCCCKASMAEALRLLCGNALSSRVDFNSFFFLTNALTVGGALEALLPTAGPADNIAALNASLRRFSPCNCDLLEVSGAAHFAAPTAPAVALATVDALSLCAIKAVAFQLSEAPEEEPQTQWDRRTLRLIRRAIRSEGGNTNSCGGCAAHCDCDDCCCAAGLLAELSSRNLSRQATLSAGPLLLRDVTVLGSVGSVLALWNDEDRRVYFVCLDAVEVLA